MKKFYLLAIAMLIVVGMSATNAMSVALPTGTLLTIDQGFEGANSFFTMAVGTATILTTNIRSTNTAGAQHAKSLQGGILLGTPQAAGSGSHGGTTVSADSNNIDIPWNFFFNTGEHFQTAAGITDNGDGTMNMAGWFVSWNGIPAINMGTGAAATFTVSGTHYTLDYMATVPTGDPSSFGGVPYALHLNGRIIPAAIPEPASLLLIGSGLVGLIGLARRKN